MKTAISIPDPIFDAAEKLAKRLKCSRSELYARAVNEFIREHKQEGITEALNEVYGEEPSKLDKELLSMQNLGIGRESW